MEDFIADVFEEQLPENAGGGFDALDDILFKPNLIKITTNVK